MYASGITFTNVSSVSPAPSTLTAAANGLSVSPTGRVILGQAVGALGNPAKLLFPTEIPFNGFNLSMTRTAAERLMIGTSVPDATASALQVNSGVSMFNWFMPLTNAAQTQGAGFINGNLFFNTFEPVPVIPGSATSIFLGQNVNNFGVSNTGSIVNIGIGFDVFTAITTASNCLGIGVQALQFLTSGINNVALGSAAAQALTTGNAIMAIGANALQNLTTASFTTGIGQGVGGGSNSSVSTFIGAGMGHLEVNDNMLYIGADNGTGIIPWIYANMNPGTFSGRWNGKLLVGSRAALPGLGTAQLHIVAGTAAAGTGPLKLTAGVNTTVIENGLFEYDGTNLFFSTGGVRHTIV